MTHFGRIVHLDRKGLVIVQDAQTHTHYAFTFGKIRGYRGETAREIGLKEGGGVTFTAEGEHVEQAELAVG